MKMLNKNLFKKTFFKKNFGVISVIFWFVQKFS